MEYIVVGKNQREHLKTPGKTPPDKRGTGRQEINLPVQITVGHQSTVGARDCRLLNLSEGGAFVSGHPFQINTPVKLRLSLPELSTIIALDGRVAHVMLTSETMKSHKQFQKLGMGIAFHKNDLPLIQTLRQFLYGTGKSSANTGSTAELFSVDEIDALLTQGWHLQ